MQKQWMNQIIEIYNFKAYGNVKSNSAQANLWDYIHDDGDIFVNGTKQSKNAAWKFEGNTVELKTDMEGIYDIVNDHVLELDSE